MSDVATVAETMTAAFPDTAAIVRRWMTETERLSLDFWPSSFAIMVRIDNALDILEDSQRERFSGLMERIADDDRPLQYTSRETAYLVGLLTQIMGVAAAETKANA